MLKKISIILAIFLSIFHALSANAAPTSSLDVFPKLPESKICDKNAVVGAWKLLMVYEVPSGREISLYTSRPLQYVIFEADSRYGDYISTIRDISAEDARDYVLADSTISQYNVNNSGQIFFYKNSIATDSLACFIVARNEGPFEIGQMLLMPPEKAAKGRMVKIYQKIPYSRSSILETTAETNTN